MGQCPKGGVEASCLSVCLEVYTAAPNTALPSTPLLPLLDVPHLLSSLLSLSVNTIFGLLRFLLALATHSLLRAPSLMNYIPEHVCTLVPDLDSASEPALWFTSNGFQPGRKQLAFCICLLIYKVRTYFISLLIYKPLFLRLLGRCHLVFRIFNRLHDLHRQ